MIQEDVRRFEFFGSRSYFVGEYYDVGFEHDCEESEVITCRHSSMRPDVVQLVLKEPTVFCFFATWWIKARMDYRSEASRAMRIMINKKAGGRHERRIGGW